MSRALGVSMLLAVAGAAVLAQVPPPAMSQAPLLAPWPATGASPASPWHFAGLPQQKAPPTRFSVVDVDGRRALRVEADASYGNLVHPVDPPWPAHALSWQWRVDRFVAGADLRSKPGDDTAVKVCAFFDLGLEHLPFFERQLLRLARTRTPEPLPAASVCYVWDAALPAGTVLPNAYTRRVRYLVLRGAADAAGTWQAEHRDLSADFLRLFGDESPQVPPVTGVAVGADADNTHGQGLAHVADLVLQP